MAHRAPKQWALTKDETINSFENWRTNLMYILSLDNNFAEFLADGFTWHKKSAAHPNRGLAPDGENIPRDNRKTAAQKNAQLELMLGQIANYASVISRNTIVKQSESLKDIWQKLRQHYGFQSTGSHFLDLCSIKLQQGERHEDLFQRLTAFFEDNLLCANSTIKHHDQTVESDEEMSPTLENTITALWLQLIHPSLPQLVKQKYGADLRNKTVASIRPEISQALSSLLDELSAIEDTKVMRTFTPRRQSVPNRKSCILCKTAGRPHTSHFLSGCKYLPEGDRRALGRSRLVTEYDCEDAEGVPYTPEQPDDDDDDDNAWSSPMLDKPAMRRVRIVQSPVLYSYYKSHLVPLTLDTGATTNMMRVSYAKHIGLPISNACQMAHQADGHSTMNVVGEVHCELTRGDYTFEWDALVVEDLDVDVLAGQPFLTYNDVAVRSSKRQIFIHGREIVTYGNKQSKMVTARRTQAYVLRAPPLQKVLLPGDYVELATPCDTQPDTRWALEPRLDNPLNQGLEPLKAWPVPQEVQSVAGIVRLCNTTSEPIMLRRGEHLCQVRPVASVDTKSKSPVVTTTSVASTPSKPFSSAVALDPDKLLDANTYSEFMKINSDYDDVFDPAISRYNGYSGNIEAVVNMGPTLPPQRKGRLPQYNRNSLQELQQKFDELEAAGVFSKPEDVGITVEYLNISFLVRKPSGGSRLVTSFGEVASYSKPQPSLMPCVDQVLRDIASWKFIIVTDLLQSFYQIPLSKSSMKYCGVATPFKGVRVYTRSAMGMPGSETCLEELMCRVLGDLIQEGCVVKLADDLYCGGETVQQVLNNWSRLLDALHKNNLRLSARKTVICPRSTVILGWIWSNGTLKASPHKIATLSSVDPPVTVQGLRSFIGAYKVLSRVLPMYANLLHPLELMVAGKKSHEKITWNDSTLADFRKAQDALQNNKVIHLPRPSDTIWIVTDGSVKSCGIGATMYSLRNDKLLLSGFFNAKLRKHQVTWLPCEVEALCIGAAVKHFSPHIIQSAKQCQVLTDSRPCVQAYNKLQRGEFSSSSRVTTFLSTLSRYKVQVQHISGAANLPSDFASRNPQKCDNQSCQVCKFIKEVEDSVVRSFNVKDIIDGTTKMPLTSRSAWLCTQQECPHLRRAHAHLSQGTRPSKKATSIPDVKRYLQVARLAADGLVIVTDDLPFSRVRERIVVPRSVLHGLLVALHFKFSHPTRNQMKLLFTRYFYALDTDKAIDCITSACHLCSAMSSIPKHLHPQSTGTPPKSIGVNFAADVMRRYRQYLFILRETVTSYTTTALVDDERRDTLRNVIITLCSQLGYQADCGIHIRVDSAPAFVSLQNDDILKKHNIQLVLGNVKNINKNPVAERAVEELGLELLHLSPDGGPVSSVTLALATSSMNSRIRHGGLSSQEMWTQRDQVTGEQLPLSDRALIQQQHDQRIYNHPHSAKSKCHGRTTKDSSDSIHVGDLVYLKGEKEKTKARAKYLVIAVSSPWCQLRKFTSSQFRSKIYDVKVCDCYLVTPTTLAQLPQGPIRGLEPSEPFEDDQDCVLSDISKPEGGTLPGQLNSFSAEHNIVEPNFNGMPAPPKAPGQITQPPDEVVQRPEEVNRPPVELTVPPDLASKPSTSASAAVDPDNVLNNTQDETASGGSVDNESTCSGSDLNCTQRDATSAINSKANPNECPRRSSRPHKPPIWMTSNAWDME